MDKYRDSKLKPLTKLARETRCQPQDNLSMDVLDAQRLGYGCHYGHYKADHPYTQEANEDRLAVKPESPPKPRQVYEFYCRGCGKKFTTTTAVRRYCSDECKAKKDGAKARAKREKMKMEVQL